MMKFFTIAKMGEATANIFAQSEESHRREETRLHMLSHDFTELGDIAF